jgi:hypothetical protein
MDFFYCVSIWEGFIDHVTFNFKTSSLKYEELP